MLLLCTYELSKDIIYRVEIGVVFGRGVGRGVGTAWGGSSTTVPLMFRAVPA